MIDYQFEVQTLILNLLIGVVIAIEIILTIDLNIGKVRFNRELLIYSLGEHEKIIKWQINEKNQNDIYVHYKTPFQFAVVVFLNF